LNNNQYMSLCIFSCNKLSIESEHALHILKIRNKIITTYHANFSNRQFLWC
jgi:hypothetical protein